jgi:hypothetical protein
MTKAISEATGLPIQTRVTNDAYAMGWDELFGEKKFKDRVKLGVSPSTDVQNVDCRTGEMITRENDDV